MAIAQPLQSFSDASTPLLQDRIDNDSDLRNGYIEKGVRGNSALITRAEQPSESGKVSQPQQQAQEGDDEPIVYSGLQPPSGTYYVKPEEDEKFFTRKCLYIHALCSVIVLIVTVAIVAGISAPIIATQKCKGVGVTSIVHPQDTVLAARVDSCQNNISFTPVTSIKNTIECYVTNCIFVTVHSEKVEYSSPEFTQVDNAISIIEESHMTSNYYVQNTTFEITAAMQSDNTTATKVYVCLFSNSSYFDIFKYPKDLSHFLGILKHGQCNDLLVTRNTLYKKSFRINNTGYYFAAISPQPQDTLNSLQYNLSLTRLFYNHSDFSHYDKQCSITHGTKPCYVSNNPSVMSCILLRALSSDVDYFNHIGIEASAIPVHDDTILPIVLEPSVAAICIVLLLFGGGLAYYRHRTYRSKYTYS